jgi:hypothetical protein
MTPCDSAAILFKEAVKNKKNLLSAQDEAKMKLDNQYSESIYVLRENAVATLLKLKFDKYRLWID